MNNLLNFIAVILITGWIMGLVKMSVSGLILTVLVFAFVAGLFKIIRRARI